MPLVFHFLSVRPSEKTWHDQHSKKFQSYLAHKVIENGKATHAGIGYSEDDHSISLWDVDSTIDFDLADTQEFWEFLETYE